MAFYFVQHGLAVDKKTDPERPLSVEGRKEVERISAYLQKAGVKAGKIYHSGKTRAEQTALILAGQISDGKTYKLSGMSPNDDVKEFAKNLQEDESMYVGHLPHMEKLVSCLVAGDENTGVVKFSNGGVVCVEKNNTGFQIKWFLIPSIC